MGGRLNRIGRLKAAELATRRTPLEIELTRRLKDALDPAGTLNPGVIVTRA